jgi:site-specific DNA-methyltransferase (adenine-specific)
MKRTDIRKNADAIDTWKVLVPEAYGAGDSFPHQILGKEIVAAPPSACTQSYLVVGPFASERAAQSFASYYRTRLFRFLVSLRKITQHALRSTYTWVPQQSWNRTWTDELLYTKYSITKDEVAFIESMIRPMEPNGEESA